MTGLSSIFFIGLGLVHLFDWDEINFAESAREMIESGDFMRVQINYQPFWEKPPFFFWLQVVSMKLFGINEFASRFPNALFGLLYLITFFFIGKKHFGQQFGVLWALLFFGSLLPHLYFKSGIIDPVFNYFIFMSIYFMLLVVGKSEEKIVQYALLAGIFSGLSVITKGPVGFLLLGLTFSVYIAVNRFQIFPKIKYILLFLTGLLLVVFSWLSIELYQNGYDIMVQFIQYQLELFSSGVAGHEQPFYYHFVVVFIGCFPISIIALPSFFRSKEETPFNIRTWMLCLFWVVMIIFSITTTKIVHYSSMTYIPLSFLAAFYLNNVMNGSVEWKKYVSRLFLIMGIVLGSIVAALPIILMNKEALFPLMNDPFAVDSLSTPLSWGGYEFIAGLVLIIGTIIAFIQFKRKGWFKGVIVISGSMGLTLLLVLFLILPKIEKFTQGPVVKFYEKLKGSDVYIECYGYKSYAQYFYFKQPYGLSDQRLEREWLLNGDIDKPVYMVSKSTNTELDEHENFELIDAQGGFRLYKRNVE
ncbi:MAG: glycosyltransferase family 39 protein [Crocinitomicaceae bacterium]|nr:glycosyltransferase family 39 protein [Crocinitomicaceae bacterium]